MSGAREGRGREDGEARAAAEAAPTRSRRDGSDGERAPAGQRPSANESRREGSGRHEGPGRRESQGRRENQGRREGSGRREGRGSGRAGRGGRDEQLSYPFFEYATGNIDLGQIGSFGRIDFEPRLYGSPRPLERTDPDPPYNWRSYEHSAPDGTGYAVDDLLERLDVPPTPSPTPSGRGAPARARPTRPVARPGDEQPARKVSSGRNRAVLTLLDQILSSGTNAAMSFLVARQVTASEFGAFGIAFAVFAVVVGFSRSVGTAPLGMRFSDVTRGEFRRAARSATGTAATLALVVGAVTALGGLALGGPTGTAVLAMGAVIPGLLLQDSWRYVFFAQGRPGAAAANDLLWGVIQGGAFAALLLNGVRSAAPYILVWGAAAAAAAVIGAIQAGVWPDVRKARAWITEHREIAGYLSAEFVTVQGALQASTLLIGTLGTLEIVGALRGTQTLLGPTQVLAIGILSFAIPELSRRKDMDARQMMRAACLLSGLVTLTGLAWGGLFLLVPDRVGFALLHDSWPLTRHILPASVIQQAGTAMMIGPACVLYSLGRARVTFRLHATQAPLLLVCSIVGLEVSGAEGTAWGYAVAFWSLVPLSFILLRREARAAEAERGLGRRPAPAAPPARDGADHLGEPFRDGDGPDPGVRMRDGTPPTSRPTATHSFPTRPPERRSGGTQ